MNPSELLCRFRNHIKLKSLVKLIFWNASTLLVAEEDEQIIHMFEIYDVPRACDLLA